MFKLFNQKPTGEDHIVEICDYIEVKALISDDNTISLNDILKEFVEPADEDSAEGIDDYSDRIRTKIEEVTDECERRLASCGGQYPFELQFNGEVIKFIGFEDPNSFLYVYLLLSTRLNMNTNRILSKINGADLLEFISAKVSENYFGHLSKSFVFGTANEGKFEDKVDLLCNYIGEGIRFQNWTSGPVDENDGGLDIVTWIDFSDQKPAKMVAFGQCKTGTHWEDQLADLNAVAFCKSWLYRQPSFDPLRMFFISDILETERWYKKATLGGILFDRLRIVDKWPHQFPAELMSNIAIWTTEAIKITGENLKTIASTD